jgi:hypothetical protein
MSIVIKENPTSFYISYDLGIDGDYEGMYAWLDKNGAKECGDSVARISSYKFARSFIVSLKRDLSKSIKLRKKDRIYIIFNNDGSLSGGFIYGNRKSAPWTGYHNNSNSEWDDL